MAVLTPPSLALGTGTCWEAPWHWVETALTDAYHLQVFGACGRGNFLGSGLNVLDDGVLESGDPKVKARIRLEKWALCPPSMVKQTHGCRRPWRRPPAATLAPCPCPSMSFKLWAMSDPEASDPKGENGVLACLYPTPV